MSELAAKWKRIAKRFREYEAEMEAGAIFDCAFSPFELTATPEEAEQIAAALAARLSDYSDGDIAREHFRRMLQKAGDPRKCVGGALEQGSRET